jgi:transcriptional regulator with XRE-family HTH domain
MAVRIHRQRLSLSQDEFASLCNLHRTYIGGIERGERNIGILNVFVIAQTLKVTAAELIRTTEQFLEDKDAEL